MMSLLLLVACAHPPEVATPDFDAALRGLVAAHDADAAGLQAAVDEVLATTDGALSFDGDLAARSAVPGALSEDQLTSFVHPDRDPAAMLGVVVGRVSNFTVDEQWPIQRLTDQRPVEPYSPELYARSFVAGEDCGPEACDTMETLNDVIRQSALMKLHYTSHKDFRILGDEQGYVAWSWIEEPAYNDAGTQGVLQTYSVDLWVPDGDGSMRIGGLWTETQLTVEASDALQLQMMMEGVDKTQGAYDDYLETQRAPGRR